MTENTSIQNGSGENGGTLASANPQPKKIQIDIGGTVLNVVDPDVEQLFLAPKAGNETLIAGLLSRCAVPIGMGVFDIPSKLMDHIMRETKNAEQMAPIEICEILREINAFTIETSSQAMSMSSDDPIDMFLCNAVKNADGMIRKFIESVVTLCDAVEGIQGQYASEKSFYLTQAMGADAIKISKAVIMNPIQNFILDLNRMAAGTGGYRILALLKALDKVAGFVSNRVIHKMYSVGSPIAMLNRLSYRIEPNQMQLHENLGRLVDLVREIAEIAGDEIPKDTIVKLFMLSEAINPSIAGATSGGSQ